MGNKGSTSPTSVEVPNGVVQDIVTRNGLDKQYYFELGIPTPESWMELACQGSDRVFSRTTMVKAVVQHFLPSSGFQHEPVLYYLNSQAYLTHLPFCSNVCFALSSHLPQTVVCDSTGFNVRNYKEFPRQFVLLSIVFYADLQVFGVELWPGDNLPPQAIKETHLMLQKTSYFGDRLKWRVSSPLHDSLFREVQIPNFYQERTLHDSDLFGGVIYQPLYTGVSYGLCKIWRNGARLDDGISMNADMVPSGATGEPVALDEHGAPIVDRGTILVAEELPIDLNPIRALVTQQLQTPLCHVALLCGNRGTPNMALRTALTDFAPYDGQRIKLVVGHADYEISLAIEAEEAAWMSAIAEANRSRVKPILQLDTTTSHLVMLKDVKIVEDVGATDPVLEATSKSIGSKALNLARFLQWDIRGTNNTGNLVSFVIPFYYFHEYVSIVSPAEVALLASPDISETVAIALCSTIRQNILSGTLPSDWSLLKEITELVEQWKSTIPFSASTDKYFTADGAIFRSSTNCEDLPGFPSAGLYVSEPVKELSQKAYEAAILKVWASVYLDKAYLERREFGVPEKDVSMAVLVMPLLASCVKANGVAVTTNPFRVDLGGNYLNVQAGTVAVTDACKGNTPEQIMFIRDGFKDLTIEYLSSSNLLPKGRHIITPPIAEKFNRVLQGIHAGFKTFHAPPSQTNAADVEFLLLQNDEIVILQARPIRVQHRPR